LRTSEFNHSSTLDQSSHFTTFGISRPSSGFRYNASSSSSTLAFSHDSTTALSDPVGAYSHISSIPQPGTSDGGSAVDLALASYPLETLTPVQAADQVYLDYSYSNHSNLGLPIYSTSGFDLLSIMARIANRPNQTLTLGPVDMSCSFVVVDVRRYDDPIVYASPTFCALTGYEEHEVLGRNCRFLQSPDGFVQKGEERQYTSPLAVAHLKKCLMADKECQARMFNYKKGGAAFINVVSIIPVPGGISNLPEEADQVAYHVGFQVDATWQPNSIMQRLRSGAYVVNYGHTHIIRSPQPVNTIQRDRRVNTTSTVVILSKKLRSLLTDNKFVDSIPISTSTTWNHSPASSSGDRSTGDAYDGNQLLSMMVLESGADFIHVLSLRGAFLYVAPSIRRVLGYEPAEVVGKSVSDYCHPADLVPLMRELKESSATLTQDNKGGCSTQMLPKKVDLLFRIMSKSEGYVWLESRGRLHVEPGKGRKAIILSGRTRGMPKLTWGPVGRAGGVVMPSESGTDDDAVEGEFWGVLNKIGQFLFVGAAVRDVLGWSADEVVGKCLEEFIDTSMIRPGSNFDPRQSVNVAIRLATTNSNPRYTQLGFEMRKKDGDGLQVTMVVYHATAPLANPSEPVICQIKVATADTHARILRPAASDVFEEFNTIRNTSWQYELQQLKFENERLREELQAFEFRALQSRSLQQPSSRTTAFTPLQVGGIPTKTRNDWASNYETSHIRHWETDLV
jgi:PAS domain-containing protein